MQIVHLAKFYPPEYGGIESVTDALAEDHSSVGHIVDVVCFTRQTAEIVVKDTLTVRRTPYLGKLSSQPLSLRYVMAAIRSARGADVLHVHTPNLLASLATLFTRRSVRVVVHWHADISGKGIFGALVRPLEIRMLDRCDAIVCTSDTYLDTSFALRKYRSKCSVIPLGISDVSVGEVNAEGGLAGESAGPYVLFVGRLVPYKGLDRLLRAVAAMTSGARCVIVGDGPELPRLRALAAELEISGRIDFLGRVDQVRLDDLISGARVFCLTSNSRLEAFGVVLLEAMRVGCPVVSMDIPGSGVSWVNDAGIIVRQGDFVAFAHAVDRIVECPDRRRALGEAARKRFVTYFTRSEMSSKFLALYKRLIERTL